MDQYLTATLEIIRTQGIVAFLLLLQMYLNSKERSALLHKNCELNRFIMDCLSKELSEDRHTSGQSQINHGGSKTNNVLFVGVSTPECKSAVVTTTARLTVHRWYYGTDTC